MTAEAYVKKVVESGYKAHSYDDGDEVMFTLVVEDGNLSYCFDHLGKEKFSVCVVNNKTISESKGEYNLRGINEILEYLEEEEVAQWQSEN